MGSTYHISTNYKPPIFAIDPDQTAIPIIPAAAVPIIPTFVTYTYTFTTVASGTAIDISTTPMKSFSLQVSKTGSVSSWDVRLQGSLDGVTFTEILTHTDATPGNNKISFSGAENSPCLYFRARCAAIDLGDGTNVVATILGVI